MQQGFCKWISFIKHSQFTIRARFIQCAEKRRVLQRKMFKYTFKEEGSEMINFWYFLSLEWFHILLEEAPPCPDFLFLS